MMYKIYKLVYNGTPQYVGRTITSLKQRKRSSYGKNTELFKTFTIELIEETDDISRERYWISYYRDINPKLFNITNGDGLDRKEYSKQYREENYEYSEDRKEYSKQYYLENTEKIKEKSKEWKEKNKERDSEYHKEYYLENKQNIVNKQIEYQLKNIDDIREYRRLYYKEYNRKKKENKNS